MPGSYQGRDATAVCVIGSVIADAWHTQRDAEMYGSECDGGLRAWSMMHRDELWACTISPRSAPSSQIGRHVLWLRQLGAAVCRPTVRAPLSAWTADSLSSLPITFDKTVASRPSCILPT